MQIFNATNVNKIFSSYQTCQLVTNHRRFRDHMCPHHQGSSRPEILLILVGVEALDRRLDPVAVHAIHCSLTTRDTGHETIHICET